MIPGGSATRGPIARPAIAWLLGGLLLAAVGASLEPAHVSVWLVGDR